MAADEACGHLVKAEQRSDAVVPSTPGCRECLEAGGVWVHLRLCLTCGHVGCCDSSPNQHATKHFHATEHPVIKSFEPGETWAWCYTDESFADEIPSFPEETPPQHYSSPVETGP